MPSTEKELQKLNKNVENAVNTMKVYFGTTAQVRNMSEKQRKKIKKWFDVAEETEKHQKQQRAFSERERDESGRFFKKQDENAKKFMGMANSVGGIFTKAGRGIEKAVVGIAVGLKDNLSKLMGTLKSEFLGLFGEESELFGLLGAIKDSVMGFFSWFARGFMFLFKKSPSWANKMNRTLEKMFGLQTKQMKMEFLEGAKGKGGSKLLAALGLALFLAAAAFGGWLRAKLMTLTLLWKGLKLNRILKIFNRKFLDLFKKTGMFGKFLTVLKKIPILGRLIKGLAFGLKWLGWPLTLLLGIIDFIKGFAATEGTLFEKIKGGLFAALEGFFEMPVMFIGWLVEKVAGLFGVEITNVGDKIMGALKVWWDFLIDLILSPWQALMDFFTGFLGADGTFWEKVRAGFGNMIEGMSEKMKKWGLPLLEAIHPIIAGVANFFIEFWNSAVKWISSKVPDWLPGGDKIIKGLQSTEMAKIEPMEKTAKTPLEMANENTAERVKAKQREEEKSQKKQDEMIEEQKKTRTESAKTQAAVNNVIANSQQNNGGGGAEVQQIPDEIENYIMAVKNHGGDFD